MHYNRYIYLFGCEKMYLWAYVDTSLNVVFVNGAFKNTMASECVFQLFENLQLIPRHYYLTFKIIALQQTRNKNFLSFHLV